MQASIIEKFPQADIDISIVWIKKLPGDSEQTAGKASEMFSDHRVSQFYDRDQIVGKEIANHIGWGGQVAWDIYLFYKPGVEWDKAPPRPEHWMHQLTDSWANRKHYRTGGDLKYELFISMEKLLS